MEIDHVLRQEPWLDAPPRTRGVARLRAARGATGDPTRAWWRVQPRLLTQKRGQFLQQQALSRSSYSIASIDCLFITSSATLCVLKYDGNPYAHAMSSMLQGYVKSQNIIFKNLFLINLHMRHDRYCQNGSCLQ